MQNIFIKKLTKQDITRSVSPCVEAVKSFFGIDINNTVDYIPIKVCYYGVNDYNFEVTIHKGYQGEKDWRLCGDIKKIYANADPQEDDLMLWRQEKGGGFSIEIIKQVHSEYSAYKKLFKSNDNYVMTNYEENLILNDNLACSPYRPYITAIKSKPFLLLAGISGTGKSRIVRELARACWEVDSEEFKAQKPSNFEMIQVKPNWNDSSELLGYISRIGADNEGNGVVYVAGDFLKFVAKAWEHTDVPYFLCLDEMNLAPVEQYFAEYLSVIETRKASANGVVTDPLIKKTTDAWYLNLCSELTSKEDIRKQFLNEGISIPMNLIVVGTVNMDETTFSFSRKVLDRAMTIEMNKVDLKAGLSKRHEDIGELNNKVLVGTCVEGVDVYSKYPGECNIAIEYLQSVNDALEGTPFKIAYRTRNEFLLYIVNNLPYNKNEEGQDLPKEQIIARALDEITNMKILSRIEGDESKVKKIFNNNNLQTTIEKALKAVDNDYDTDNSICIKKLVEMEKRLSSGYTSFWS